MDRQSSVRPACLGAVLLLMAGCGAPAEDMGGTSAAKAEAATPPAPPFFVGSWAAAETACGHAAWAFTETGLATPGEVSCRFDAVAPTPRGYDIAATCTAEGPPRPERIILARGPSAGVMLVEGGPFNPVRLIACGGQPR